MACNDDKDRFYSSVIETFVSTCPGRIWLVVILPRSILTAWFYFIKQILIQQPTLRKGRIAAPKLLTKHQPILSHFYVLCIHLYSFQFHFSPHSLSQLHHHTTVSWLWFSSFISSSRTSDLIRQRRFS